MKKTIVIGLVIGLALVMTFASVDAFSFKKFKKVKYRFFEKPIITKTILRDIPIEVPIPLPRDVISVSNPANYNETDLLNFAEQKIDIHNWATWYGGKMTPYRNPNGSFYLSENQEQLIIDLYDREQVIFWIGVTTDHITFIFEDPYEDTANAIKSFTDFFAEEELLNAKVGLYIPIWHDEIITRLRENMTWQEQYDYVEDARDKVELYLESYEWDKVKWTISGQDFMEHNETFYQLTNDVQSYWFHHTDVTETNETEDLVYHHNLSKMADEEWKAVWGNWSVFAWTDNTLVDGNKGSRELTELGEQVFG